MNKRIQYLIIAGIVLVLTIAIPPFQHVDARMPLYITGGVVTALFVGMAISSKK